MVLRSLLQALRGIRSGSVLEGGASYTETVIVTVHNQHLFTILLLAPQITYAQEDQLVFSSMRSSFQFVASSAAIYGIICTMLNPDEEKGGRSRHSDWAIAPGCADTIRLWMIFALNGIFERPTRRRTISCKEIACRVITASVPLISTLPPPRFMGRLF